MKRILYLDDDDQFVDRLRREHGNLYHIEHIKDITRLREELDSRDGTSDWPDILLLDLYWPKDKAPRWKGAPLSQEDIRRVEQAVKSILDAEVQPVVERLNKAYTALFTFCGLDWLELVRSKYGPDKLPVILYTSKGHLLLHQKEEQDWLSKASTLGAHWLPKSTATAQAESQVFHRVIDERDSLRPRFINLVKDRRFIVSVLASVVVSFVVGLVLGILGM